MSTPCHALVFRDVKDRVSLASAYRAIAAELEDFRQTGNDESFLSAFLRAAELETLLTDDCEESFLFTGLLARAIADHASKQETAKLVLHLLKPPAVDTRLEVSRPEGFAFYGLHPLDYVDTLEQLDISGTQPIVVIGIRTIGLALGYVVVNSLVLRCGKDRSLQYLSVRPHGHSYDRHCGFDEDQRHTILQALNARFIIVDEGPGLSGSSFLSVGEALVELGVMPEQIVFLCSREIDPDRLVAPNASQRWSKFKSQVAGRSHFLPEPDAVPKCAGAWRSTAFAQETDWPALWTSMLPATYHSADGRDIFDYHGLGHYGDTVRLRINALAEKGFTMPATRVANGFSRGAIVFGHRLSQQDLSQRVLDRMAEYLAARNTACPVPDESVSMARVEEMARFNFQQATGNELPTDFNLALHRPVIADAKMMPHMWLQPDDGTPIQKLDCGTHGDNHFYPGPVDIAWDVAGAIVEWRMSERDRSDFVARYNASAGDNVSARVEPYLVAYAAFRNGYCRMAASAMAHDPAEQARLLRDAERYRCILEGRLNHCEAVAASHE